ncbi:ABC transporter substrate-binding protein [Anaerobacillus alkaliphilus]|uniref:ABC transporter substrate-binding protein n=1 Tax=Anaerobacillus alkaliphilus TaxID=1548597 RepID=A0A4Q0W1L3_9BACI|nr:ABC transporter substrate-binding protein [Anaerobacillus alkaliphilus]RXJ04481.1 ABC transporter substrate-binding protein [Anaerobacillus alkaliphilus]
MSVPVGKVYVVDPSPLNWLFVLFHTMEELVRADREGYVTPSLASEFTWINETTLEVKLRKGVTFHNGEVFNADSFVRSFSEEQRWFAPHPPGTWMNLPRETTVDVVDDYTVRFLFPKADGLALVKLRAVHMGNELFWQSLGFGYAREGSGEGRW